MLLIDGSSGKSIQPKRESAYFGGGRSLRCAIRLTCVNVTLSVRLSSNRLADNCLLCYPSLDRSACLAGGPAAFFRRFIVNQSLDIGYQCHSSIELLAVNVISDVAGKQKLGRRLCRENQSSWPQWLYLALLAVLKATPSAVLRVPQVVLWLQKCWALIQQAPQLPAQRSVCFATTQASTAVSNHTFGARFRHQKTNDHRRKSYPAVVIQSGTDASKRNALKVELYRALKTVRRDRVAVELRFDIPQRHRRCRPDPKPGSERVAVNAVVALGLRRQPRDTRRRRLDGRNGIIEQVQLGLPVDVDFSAGLGEPSFENYRRLAAAGFSRQGSSPCALEKPPNID